MHLAQLCQVVKGPMSRQQRENGEKAEKSGDQAGLLPSASGSYSEAGHIDTDIDPDDGPSANWTASVQHYQHPGLKRRFLFFFERLRDVWADAWRRDREERNITFLWGCVFLSLGAATYYHLPDEPSLIVLLSLGCLIAAISYWQATSGKSGLLPFWALMALIGLSAASFHGQFIAGQVLQKPISTGLEATILRMEMRPVGERWLLAVEKAEKLTSDNMPERILVTRRAEGPAFSVGDRISAWVRLEPLARPVFPGGFDYGRYLWARSIGAQGYLGKSVKLLPAERTHPLSDSFWFWIEQTRTLIATELRSRLSEQSAGLAIAMSVGKRDYLAETDKEVLRQSGLAHILAISGMHMAIVTLSAFAALRAILALSQTLVLKHPIKKWAAAGALLVATCYLLLSGMAVSTTRAYVMASIFLLAVLMGRPALTLHNLALALCILVLFQPYAVAEAGLQMSFAATAALIATYDLWQTRASRRETGLGRAKERWLHQAGSKVLHWFAGIATTALIAGLAILPFSMTHFQQVAPLGLLANLLAMPIISLVVMPLGLLSAILTPLGLQSLPLVGVEWGLEAILSIATTISKLSPVDWMLSRGHWALPLLATLALAFMAIHRTRLAMIGILSLACAIPLQMLSKPPDLWISQKGDRLAIRDSEGRWQLIGRAKAGFEFRQLLRNDGDPRALKENWEIKVESECDIAGCRSTELFATDGTPVPFRLALVRHYSAMSEDCARNELLVSKLSLAACATSHLFIDKEQLAGGGAHFVWFSKAKGNQPEQYDWQIKTRATTDIGRRPWQRSQ